MAAAKKKSAKKKTVKKVIKKTKLKKVAVKKIAAPPVKKSATFKNFLSPLDDRLIVKISEMERKTAGGLYIPDTVGDVSGNLEGLVVAVGKGHRSKKGRLRPMDVKVGDCVIFSQYSGDKIKMQEQDVVILRESDVMGIMNK